MKTGRRLCQFGLPILAAAILVACSQSSLYDDIKAKVNGAKGATVATLTVLAGSGGTIATPSSGSLTVTLGQAANIAAQANVKHVFSLWNVTSGSGASLADATSASATVTLASGDATVMANFTGIIETVAGNGSAIYAGDGIAATSASLYDPYGVAFDLSGNLYIADYGNNRIRKVDTSGNITTVAGNGSATYAGDSGAAISASLHQPSGVALDSSGNIYIADYGNSRIRKVDKTSGNITTVAGNGTPSYGGDNGVATSANLKYPSGVALDSSGNIYIADTGNNRIRKVDTSGTITTVAGNSLSGGYSGDGGPAASASIWAPTGVALDSSGNIYIADSANNCIRKVDTSSQHIITTIAGSINHGYSGDGGAATSAILYSPYGVTLDSSGNIYIADSNNNCIRKVSASTGKISTIAGIGGALGTYSGDGGAATLAKLSIPEGLALDSSGNVYIADTYSSRIRKVYQ
jgi:sugar lactone lactonase YvrE